jgi:hypothetical protein
LVLQVQGCCWPVRLGRWRLPELLQGLLAWRVLVLQRQAWQLVWRLVLQQQAWQLASRLVLQQRF